MFIFCCLLFLYLPSGLQLAPPSAREEAPKNFQKKYRSQQKDHRPRGEKTACGCYASNGQATSLFFLFVVCPFKKQSSENKIGEKPKYRLHPDSGQVSLRAQLNSTQLKTSRKQMSASLWCNTGLAVRREKERSCVGVVGVRSFLFSSSPPPLHFFDAPKKMVMVRFRVLAIPQLVTRPRVPCTDHCGGF